MNANELYFEVVNRKSTNRILNGFLRGGGMPKSYLEAELQKWGQSGHPTDIRPNSGDTEMNESGWNFGNAKKRKRLVEEFARKSSIHGTAYICHGGKKIPAFTRFFYRVLFVVSLVLVVVNVVYLLREKLTRESTFINSINKDLSQGLQEDPDYFPVYPKITICREPPYKTDFNSSYLHLVEYAFLALGYPFVVLTPDQVTNVIQLIMHKHFKNGAQLGPKALELKRYLLEFEGQLQDLIKTKDENFTIKQFVKDNSVECQDFFISCNVMVYSMNCCKVFNPVLTTLGLCYSLDNSDLIVDLIQKAPFEISLVIDLPSPPKIGKATEEGFLVFLDDPLDKNFEMKRVSGQRAPPGLVTTITSELIKFQRGALYTSWYGATTNCPTMPPEIRFKDDGERFSYDGCGTFYISEIFRTACACEWILVSDLPSKRYCDPVDHYTCFLPSCMQNNLSEIREKCNHPCISYSYRSEASYIGLGLSNISRIEIMYNSKQYVSLEYRTTTVSGLLSQVGGALGLYLGASIITVVEIVIFCASWTWYRIAPSASTASVLPTHHTKRAYSRN